MFWIPDDISNPLSDANQRPHPLTPILAIKHGQVLTILTPPTPVATGCQGLLLGATALGQDLQPEDWEFVTPSFSIPHNLLECKWDMISVSQTSAGDSPVCWREHGWYSPLEGNTQ